MALANVDRSDEWNKALRHPPVWNGTKWTFYGWHPRKTLPLPTRVIVHTTNGNLGSSYDAECTFLRDSPNVGAHYLVAKDGRIRRLLNPATDIAWHAGAVLAGWDNNRSIGIEMHYTPGEAVGLTQIEACGRLILDLCAVYTLPSLTMSLTMHRAVALWPDGTLGRKKDPSNMTDPAFITWRNTLQNQRSFYHV